MEWKDGLEYNAAKNDFIKHTEEQAMKWYEGAGKEINRALYFFPGKNLDWSRMEEDAPEKNFFYNNPSPGCVRSL